jgi:transglutaminase-like putative cysteine protease
MNPLDIIEADDIWRLSISHRTVVTYPEPVTASYNEVRMQPSNEPGQAVLSTFVELDPYEGSLGFWDYFGTRVSAFDLHRPHTSLTITASTTVERFRRPGENSASLSWDELAATDYQDRFEEYLAFTPLTTAEDGLDSLGHEVLDSVGSPLELVAGVCDWVNRNMNYEQGSTTLSTSAMEAFIARRGVCQDLTHVAIAMLRSVGVPARYVSGYVHPDGNADIGTTVQCESHAWFEAWTGSWQHFDPTTGKAIGLGHVITGRGRDYRDTPPIRGVYAGPEATSNDVTVQITRLR